MAIIGPSCAKEENMSQSVTKPIEVVQVSERVVTCEGGLGRLGHPKVYLHMQGPLGTEAHQVVCPYCSRVFVLTGEPATAGH
jgi:uncharacterized Zn-finger protein